MCAGCLGVTLTVKGVIEPAVHAVAPAAKVVVSSGIRIPDGASLIT
jgi:Fe-S cluster biogenesis protein NfuA